MPRGAQSIMAELSPKMNCEFLGENSEVQAARDRATYSSLQSSLQK